MSVYTNRSAYFKAPWQFEIRDNPVSDPGPGQLLIEIAACAVCGTDAHFADRLATDWQVFGHEVAGVVKAVGEGVSSFSVGDRVALDSSAPCGKCPTCLPEPYGRGRPDLCKSPVTYWGMSAMGFGELLLAPYQCAVHIPDSMSFDVASLVEPVGVSIDLVQTADVGWGDRVLILGPGPLGLGAVTLAKRAGADHVAVAGRSTSVARLKAAEALGADEIIEIDRTPLAEYNFGFRNPDKVLVTSPPNTLAEAMNITAFGGTVAFIGFEFGPASVIEFDADRFHYGKLALKASFGAPGIHAAKSIRVLAEAVELGRELISHRFRLDEIGDAMQMLRDSRKSSVTKMVMTRVLDS